MQRIVVVYQTRVLECWFSLTAKIIIMQATRHSVLWVYYTNFLNTWLVQNYLHMAVWINLFSKQASLKNHYTFIAIILLSLKRITNYRISKLLKTTCMLLSVICWYNTEINIRLYTLFTLLSYYLTSFFDQSSKSIILSLIPFYGK